MAEYLACPDMHLFWLTFYLLKKDLGVGGGVAGGKDPPSVLSYCTMYIFRMFYQLHLFYFCRL